MFASWMSNGGFSYEDTAYQAYQASPTVANANAAIAEAQANQARAASQGDGSTVSDMANLIANIASATHGSGNPVTGGKVSTLLLGLAGLGLLLVVRRRGR